MRWALLCALLATALGVSGGVAATTAGTSSLATSMGAFAGSDEDGQSGDGSATDGLSSAQTSYFGFGRRPELLDRLGGSDLNEKSKFAVIYVHATELLINGAGFPGAFTSFIENALKNQEASPCEKIAVIIGGCSGDSMKLRKAESVTKRLLREIVDGFKEGGGNVKSNSFCSSFHKDSDKNLASNLKTFFDGDVAIGGSSPALSYAYIRSTPAGSGAAGSGQDLSASEINSMRKYVNVVDHFVSAFVTALYREDDGGKRMLKVADLIAALESAVTSIGALNKTGSGGKVASSSLAMIRYRVWSAVYPIYRKNVDSLYADAFMQFDRESKKVPANSMLSKNLKKKAAECVHVFAEDAKVLRKDFAAALSGIDSVYSGGGGGGGSGKIPSTQWNSMGFTTDTARLSKELVMKAADKVQTLWLQGLYNPYIRDAPWAPTHINFNYLIDPKAIVFDSQYDQLYDAEEEKIVTNRADGIALPGLAKVVFDPNRHPVPLNEKPWWVTLKEFYFSD